MEITQKSIGHTHTCKETIKNIDDFKDCSPFLGGDDFALPHCIYLSSKKTLFEISQKL